jgi:uncharacterized protein with von Willebrand factor type A (vWA) domain
MNDKYLIKNSPILLARSGLNEFYAVKAPTEIPDKYFVIADAFNKLMDDLPDGMEMADVPSPDQLKALMDAYEACYQSVSGDVDKLKNELQGYKMREGKQRKKEGAK